MRIKAKMFNRASAVGQDVATVAAYAANDVTVSLITGIADVSGSCTSDKLIGIHAAGFLRRSNRSRVRVVK